MTPAQLEHLRLIKAHLETLLEGAKKRTPGEWKAFQPKESNGFYYCDSLEDRTIVCYSENAQHNAAFIASCAGNAEAGWKSTLAAIKAFSFEATCDSYIAQEDAEALLLAILAVWPIESLQK